MAQPIQIDVARLAAIDVHVHLEAGGTSEAETAARQYFGESGAPARSSRRSPTTTARATWPSSSSRSTSGSPAAATPPTTRSCSSRPTTRDVAIAFVSVDPTRGPEAVREARRLLDDRPRSRPEAAPARSAVLRRTIAWRIRSTSCSPKPNCRSCSTPGTAASARESRAGRRPPEIRQPDADRRRRRGFSGPADRHGAPVVSVAGRSDLDLPAQADRLHRPVGMVAEVFLADAWCSTRTRCSSTRCCSDPTTRGSRRTGG